MKIEYTDRYSSKRKKPRIQEDLVYWFQQHIEGQVDRAGAVETAISIAESTASALGRLCEILAEKDILDVDDLVEIAGETPNKTWDEIGTADPHHPHYKLIKE